MLKRFISSIVAIPILIFFLYMGGMYLKVATFGVVVIMLYEYYRSTGIFNPYTMVGGGLTALFIYFFGFQNIEIYLTFLMFVFLLAGLNSEKLNIKIIGIFQISIFYIVIPIYLLNLIHNSAYPKMLWLIFLLAWGSDTCAYFVGRTFGKTPLAPKISPKKTVAGSVGGIVGATIAATVFYYIFDLSQMTSPIVFIIFMIISTVISQLGDLIASSIKRSFDIKDFGNIMPGHGGLLDRFDSVIILIPIFYLFLELL
jgi:phosphatidate cytidylyltransferase